MNPELLQLQHQVYREAMSFAQAQSDYWTIHDPNRRGEQGRTAARECLKVGAQYGLALKALLQHLERFGADEQDKQEITRTKRLLVSLKGEVEFFSID